MHNQRGKLTRRSAAALKAASLGLTAKPYGYVGSGGGVE